MERSEITDAVYNMLHDHVGTLTPGVMQRVAGLVADRLLASPADGSSIEWRQRAIGKLRASRLSLIQALAGAAFSDQGVWEQAGKAHQMALDIESLELDLKNLRDAGER